MILPNAAWRSRPGLARLAEVLGGDTGMARFVGGAVRDTLLGVAVADIDIATRHAPDTVMALLAAAEIRSVPTGIVHGTVTALLEGGPVEITTLRRDVSTDGRHATVAFTDDWREDAARRDFTMNALYADPANGALFDYFGGVADLQARHVRFIGDPLRRIAEDHLRILRFFRFLARFGDTADPDALAACTARARDLMALSRERIREELLKLLVARDAIRVTALMLAHGIFVPVLPEIADAEPLARLARREALAGEQPDALRRLAALLPRDAADGVAVRLKLSNEARKRIGLAVEPFTGADWKALAYRVGPTAACDRILLSALPDADAAALAAACRTWAPPRFPLQGGALIARGLARGPEVARMLRAIEERWIAEDFPDAARVDQLADEAVGSWLRAQSNA